MKAEQEKAEADRKAKAKAEADEKKRNEPYDDLGHSILSQDGNKYYCMQYNGAKVGDASVSTHFKNNWSAWSFSTLYHGSCDSDGWARENKDFTRNFDGVTATIWSWSLD